MMPRIFLLLILILTLGACNETAQRPKDLLSEEQMVQVLVALHLAEARSELLQIPPDSIRPLLEARYEDIFAEQEVDTAHFNRSLAYYEGNPEQMDSLYQKVIDNLVELEATYRSIPDTSQPIGVDTVLPEAMPVDSISRRKL